MWLFILFVLFFKQKTAYEMRISDWSSDVCSSDLHDLDTMLAERDRLNADIQTILDQQTDAWGIKVANVEIKHVDLNENMIRAIAKQAEAERQIRRAACRERVDQYVQSPVIAVFSKSTQNHTHTTRHKNPTP